jgi:outer membrane murein-binding lipoprotein Lpp
MTKRLSRCTVLAVALACALAAGCHDRQQPKPITSPAVPAAAR